MYGTVLVVDDASVVRAAMKRIMSRCGYDVVEAADGEQALKQFDAHQDMKAVFLDLNMPVMGGMEFLERFRSDYADVNRPPVIVVSTETEMSSILKAISLGATEYVMKPFDESIIKGKLDLVGMPYQQ